MMPLLSAYIACLVIAILMRDLSKAATASALLANWVCNTVLVSITIKYSDEAYPWLGFMAVDYLTALVVFGWRTSWWQSAIIALYALEMICHSAFAYSDQERAAHYYGYWALYYIAVAQIATFGGWFVADAVRHLRRPDGRAPSDFLGSSWTRRT